MLSKRTAEKRKCFIIAKSEKSVVQVCRHNPMYIQHVPHVQSMKSRYAYTVHPIPLSHMGVCYELLYVLWAQAFLHVCVPPIPWDLYRTVLRTRTCTTNTQAISCVCPIPLSYIGHSYMYHQYTGNPMCLSYPTVLHGTLLHVPPIHRQSHVSDLSHCSTWDWYYGLLHVPPIHRQSHVSVLSHCPAW